MNENQYAFDGQPMSFSDSHESYDDFINFHDDIDLGFAIPSQLEIVAKQNELLDNYYSRLEQYTLLDMDDCSLDNVNEDNAETENITNINIGINDIDDNGTLALEEPFFLCLKVQNM